MIINLKRDNQRLIEENSVLFNKLKDKDARGTETNDKDQPLMSRVKKARKILESFPASKTSREESGLSSNLAERLEESAKAKRSSLSSIRINKWPTSIFDSASLQ